MNPRPIARAIDPTYTYESNAFLALYCSTREFFMLDHTYFYMTACGGRAAHSSCARHAITLCVRWLQILQILIIGGRSARIAPRKPDVRPVHVLVCRVGLR
jgi:hypothetical protein